MIKLSKIIDKVRNSGLIHELNNRSKDGRLFEFYKYYGYLDTPRLLYLLNNIKDEVDMGLCEYFSIDDDYTMKCSLGLESETNCTSLNHENCSWKKLGNFINELSEEDLGIVYDKWVGDIAVKYSVQRINAHLFKHLNEDKSDINKWLASAENLYNIHNKVKRVDKNSEIIRKYEKIIKHSNINIRIKLKRLLNHYRKHFYKATKPPDARSIY
jgi:hypothetical protein